MRKYASCVKRWPLWASVVSACLVVAVPVLAATAGKLPPTPADTSGANVKGAQQYLLAHLGIPKFVPEGPAFNIKKVTKPVWLLEAPANVAPDQQVAAGFIQAAKAAGVKYHVCLANGTPEGNALCLQEATAQGAGSAVIWSQAINTILQPIRSAMKAGVKVVEGNASLRIGEPVNPNVAAEVSHDYYGAGEENGGYAAAALGGAADALCINIPDFVTGTAVCQGFTKILRQFVPGAKVKTVNIPAAGVNTEVGASVSQAVLSDPRLNFIMNAYDFTVPLVTTELHALGKAPSKMMVGGQNGTTQAIQAIKSGDYDVVSAGQNSFWWGWAFLDAGARAQVGAIGKTAVLTTPNELFTTQTMASYSGPITFQGSNQLYGLGNGSVYESGYKKLWKG